MGQKSEESSKEKSRKEDIIKAGVELFSEHGYHNTTMAEIADQAGVAKGTVYWYFDSKEKLFWGLIVTGVEKINKQLTTLINDSNKSAVDKLEEIIRLYLSFFKDNADIAMMMQESSVSPGEYFRKEMAKLRTEAIDNVAKIIRQGQEDNEIISDIEVKELANMILGTITGSYNPHVYEIEDVENKVQLLLNVILNGVSSK